MADERSSAGDEKSSIASWREGGREEGRLQGMDEGEERHPWLLFLGPERSRGGRTACVAINGRERD